MLYSIMNIINSVYKVAEKEPSTFQTGLLSNFFMYRFPKNFMFIPPLSHSLQEIKKCTVAAILIENIIIYNPYNA